MFWTLVLHLIIIFLSKVLVLAYFSGPFVLSTRQMRACYQYKVLSVWSYILLAQTIKKPKQNSSICCDKMTSTKNRIRPTTVVNQRDFSAGRLKLSQEVCASWLVCIAYNIFSGIWLVQTTCPFFFLLFFFLIGQIAFF